jgi:hypothetical protein
MRIMDILSGLRVRQRLDSLKRSVALAERLMSTGTKKQRLLVSGDQVVVFEGNDHELRAAMSRLAGRTRSCVTVAVVVGEYHRRGCMTRRGGGYDPAGN